jgi:hypothetical protein
MFGFKLREELGRRPDAAPRHILKSLSNPLARIRRVPHISLLRCGFAERQPNPTLR